MNTERKRIAIIGHGIAGLTRPYFLSHQNGVLLFEAAGYPGGNTNTVDGTVEQIQGNGGARFDGPWTGYGFQQNGLKPALRISAAAAAAPGWATLS